MVDGGRPLSILDRILEQYRVVQHGVSMYFGSAAALNREHLARLKALVRRTHTPWLSDHLCWGSVDGQYSHDLLPMPYTWEAVRVTAAKIRQARDVLEVPVIVENVSSYAEFHLSRMSEWEFLTEVAERADCGILLDVNNIYVSSENHGFDPCTYLNAIPAERVAQIHIAGHSRFERFVLDSHDHPVLDPVWRLYARAIERCGPTATLLEWDQRIPPFSLREDFPGLRAVLGRVRFEDLARAYLAECPSRSYTLRNLGARLPAWLEANPAQGGPPPRLALDMARLEWAHIEAFDAADLALPEPVPVLRAGTRLTLQPHLRLLELAYPVDRMLASLRRTQSAAPDRERPPRRVRACAPEAVFLAVHRHDLSVYYRRLAPEAFRILRALQSGAGAGAALEAGFAGSAMAEAERPEFLRLAFQQWAGHGWFGAPLSDGTGARR